jgi:hypothetical protein
MSDPQLQRPGICAQPDIDGLSLEVSQVVNQNPSPGHSDGKANPLLLGFDRQRWEHRKAELRTRLAKRLAVRTETVKSGEQFEAEHCRYSTCGGTSYLRRKFMLEAEAARRRSEQTPVKRPNNASPLAAEPKCDMSEGKDSTPLKCNTTNSQERTCRVCGKSFQASRSDASLCSARCRMKASRAR